MALATLGALPPAAQAHAPRRAPCCHVAAGTVVKVELVDQVSSATQKQGDTFALRLAEPLIVNGQVVLRAGATGVGQVIQSSPPGIGGKPAAMVLAASYVNARHGRVPLDALQLAGSGKDNSTTSHVLGIGGIAFAPLGLIGIAVQGGQVVFKSGEVASAKVASDITLPPLARATRRQIAEAAASNGNADLDDAGPVAIAPPPAGEGQVVFFRAKSLMGSGQWFNVREDGKVLGKLANGAYFIQPETPGVHAYTAVLEPELKDKLKLKVDAGETYFVEGTITGGLVIGAANLSPSDRATFNTDAMASKLGAAPAVDKPGSDAALVQPAPAPVVPDQPPAAPSTTPMTASPTTSSPTTATPMTAPPATTTPMTTPSTQPPPAGGIAPVSTPN